VILLGEIEQPLDAMQVAEKLMFAFAAPHLIDDRQIDVTLSIGISVYPDDAQDVESVMRNADTAMYRAKANGRNNFTFFRDDMNTPSVGRDSLKAVRAARQIRGCPAPTQRS
jgi:diguanylate cyclase (GGDEF)-like protein